MARFSFASVAPGSYKVVFLHGMKMWPNGSLLSIRTFLWARGDKGRVSESRENDYIQMSAPHAAPQ